MIEVILSEDTIIDIEEAIERHLDMTYEPMTPSREDLTSLNAPRALKWIRQLMPHASPTVLKISSDYEYGFGRSPAPDCCWYNVALYCHENEGHTMRFCWQVMRHGHQYYFLYLHAVVVRPDGSMLDITPDCFGATKKRLLVFDSKLDDLSIAMDLNEMISKGAPLKILSPLFVKKPMNYEWAKAQFEQEGHLITPTRTQDIYSPFA